LKVYKGCSRLKNTCAADIAYAALNIIILLNKMYFNFILKSLFSIENATLKYDFRSSHGSVTVKIAGSNAKLVKDPQNSPFLKRELDHPTT
jgi:hypothetical protein